jgi:uncharacterized protein
VIVGSLPCDGRYSTNGRRRRQVSAPARRNFDFAVSLFELRPDGKYLQIPPFQTRASFANDRTHRRLLTPGKRERLSFQSIRLASLQLERGSRLVVVLQVIKNQGQEINYGTGKPVADETIADAGVPLTIRWLSGSFIEIPVVSGSRR